MSERKLPENFVLPNAADFDGAVHQLDEMVQITDGARSFLGAERVKRREYGSFGNYVLSPLSHVALAFELKDSEGALVDPNHKLANSALSGMLFGHFMNEFLYTSIDVVKPYKNKFVISSLLLDQFAQPFDDAGGAATVEGYRIGASAMAVQATQYMSKSAHEKINSWKDNITDLDDAKAYFKLGVGMTLYTAWDVYGDLLMAEGRVDEVTPFKPKSSKRT